MQDDIVIVSCARIPVGKLNGALSTFSAPKLGAFVVEEVIKRAQISPELIDEVIFGNVISAGVGQNPARQASIFGGIPDKVPAFTVNKVCGSGLKAVALAAQAIKAGDAEIVLAGGIESMSNAPYLLTRARQGYRLGHGQVLDAMIIDGLWCAFNNFHMGNTGEIIAKKFNVTREDQDAFAVESHRRAIRAIDNGDFKDEIVPIKIKTREEVITFDTDEGPRRDTSIEKLAKLKPVFEKNGTITAGNASSINDGAAAVIVMSGKKADELDIKPLVRIKKYCSSGVKPALVMYAPVPAIRKLTTDLNMKISDFDLIELNEAFAAQAVAVARELDIDFDRLNVNGGAIALGHPIGASGARILVTLIYAMLHKNKQHGLAALCLGGGNAIAMAIEKI